MKIKTPITNEQIKKMRAGEIVYISGTIYTGRDAAHQRLVETLNRSEKIAY